MLEGYPLRKYDWKDWLLMALSSSLFLQFFVIILASNYMNYFGGGLTFEGLAELSIYGTVFGTIISLPITLLVVYYRKLPFFNRKQLTKEQSFIFRGLTKDDFFFLLKYIPSSYILYMIGSGIVAYFFGVSEAANQIAVESLFDDIPIWVMFIMIVVVAPVVEELLFRGLFLFPGDRLNTTWVRLLISAVLFGLIHGPSDVYTAYTYIGMGFIFAYASKRTQTVEAAIIYHVLNNLLGFLAILSL